MTPTRLQSIRTRMHLPIRSLARWVGVNEASIRQMEAGQRAIPAPFGVWVEKLGQWIERNPPPEKER